MLEWSSEVTWLILVCVCVPNSKRGSWPTEPSTKSLINSSNCAEPVSKIVPLSVCLHLDDAASVCVCVCVCVWETRTHCVLSAAQTAKSWSPAEVSLSGLKSLCHVISSGQKKACCCTNTHHEVIAEQARTLRHGLCQRWTNLVLIIRAQTVYCRAGAWADGWAMMSHTLPDCLSSLVQPLWRHIPPSFKIGPPRSDGLSASSWSSQQKGATSFESTCFSTVFPHLMENDDRGYEGNKEECSFECRFFFFFFLLILRLNSAYFNTSTHLTNHCVKATWSPSCFIRKVTNCVGCSPCGSVACKGLLKVSTAN